MAALSDTFIVNHRHVLTRRTALPDGCRLLHHPSTAFTQLRLVENEQLALTPQRTTRTSYRKHTNRHPTILIHERHRACLNVGECALVVDTCKSSPEYS